jgi:hypothetical protein
MTRVLRGLRYQPDPNGPKGWLVKAIRDDIHYVTVEQVNAFYRSLTDKDAQARRARRGPGHTITRRDWAFLGCNDRYFLLTRLCGRKKDMYDELEPYQRAWLYDRCREVEADPDNHLDLWARYHYKSSILTFGGNVQDIVCDPEIKIAIFSATKQIAWEFLGQIKEEFEANEILKAVYPDVLWRNPRKKDPFEGRPPKWGVARGIVVKRRSNPKEATIEAHGLIDGQPTSRHYDKHCYDDMVTQDNLSPEQMKKTTLRYEMADNLGGHHGVRKQFAGTRYNFGDTYGVIIIENRGGIIPRIYPATDDGTLNGKPVFLTPARWEKVKSEQRSTVSAQMLLNPVAGQDQIFRVEWNRPYEVRPSVLNVYIMGDPSKGKTKTSDRTAIVVIGIDQQNNKYLLDGYCHRMPQSERWKCLKSLYVKWSAMSGVQSIAVGWETYGLQTDHEYFIERMREEKDAPVFTVAELNWVREGQQSKISRVERLEPEFRGSRFYLPGLVWHPEIRGADGYQHPDKLCTWKVADSSDPKAKGQVILYSPLRELSRAMRAVDALGQPYRKAACIRRVEQLGEAEHKQTTIYDLTRVLFEEMMLFPFGPRDDLVDAASRYNDLNPSTPMSIEESAAAAPSVHPDS